MKLNQTNELFTLVRRECEQGNDRKQSVFRKLIFSVYIFVDRRECRSEEKNAYLSLSWYSLLRSLTLMCT